MENTRWAKVTGDVLNWTLPCPAENIAIYLKLVIFWWDRGLACWCLATVMVDQSAAMLAMPKKRADGRCVRFAEPTSA